MPLTHHPAALRYHPLLSCAVRFANPVEALQQENTALKEQVAGLQRDKAEADSRVANLRGIMQVCVCSRSAAV